MVVLGLRANVRPCWRSQPSIVQRRITALVILASALVLGGLLLCSSRAVRCVAGT